MKHSQPLWIFACLLVAASAAQASTFTVTRGDDPAPDGCLVADCSLREALDAAVATPEGDTISLAAGQYTVTRGTLLAVGAVHIEGAGAAATRIVGNGAFDLFRVSPLAELTLQGVEMSSQDQALGVDSATVTLRDARIATGGGVVSGASDSGPTQLRIENSTLGDAVGCFCGSGSINVIDSTVNAVVMYDGSGDATLDRVQVLGPSATYGVAFSSSGELTIRDSSISGHAAPLVLSGVGADVHVTRTRFNANSGPMTSLRDSMVWMDEVEFRDNVVDATHLTAPAVLLAQDTGAWRISRALFIDNLGGGGGSGPNRIGATVRVLAGANVVIDNATFSGNTFHTDVVGGVGHTLGVDTDASASTILWLFHTTLRSASSIPSGTLGSLLAVRGAAANVRIYNSVLQGTCAFSSASIFQAVGNFESPGHTCAFNVADNSYDVPVSNLFLGALADHGGFTQTYSPSARYSPLVDAADATWCNVANGIFGATDQRRYLRPFDGMACDVGAVEAGALSDTIFSDDFDG